ncbi:hypothetical protein OCS_02569 [Ophiocordyceps sinensis CO18]|uniref:Uncharacterized protein n=1 Tax=Ophiocordyceps sinensis (strain Co18 / CGMCC 3.14243) TaxID=911162 RepID=T5AH35_OPHSC|nr:hypothetical protein OCS_02569 [Ophiocordyceps sinensis CO18]
MPGKLQPVTFRDDARFHHLSTEAEVSRAWEAYNLPASGFVHVAASQLATLGLEPNKNVKEGMENVYMISAFHSLHCLQSIHKTFARLRANATAAANGTAPQDAFHAAHCFDYLRQSLLCAGDMALEGPDSNPEAGESRLRGWGVEHQCRSWDSLVEWRDSHSVS